MKLIKVQKSLTVVFDNGDIITHADCTDELFEDVLLFKDDEQSVKELLLPEFNTKALVAESKKEILIGIESSAYLAKRGSSVYIPRISELSVPEDLVMKILMAEMEGNVELVDTYLNFWTLTSINPDSRVRQNLFWFLDRYGMTISKSGLFVAYRNVMIKNKQTIISAEYAEAISSNYITAKYKLKQDPESFEMYYDDIQDDFVILTADQYNDLVDEYDEDSIDDDDCDYEDCDNCDGWDCDDDDDSEENEHPEDYLTHKGNLAELYAKLSESPEAPIYTDAHTRTFNIKIGEVVSMDRKKCDAIQENTCSSGLHVAGKNWLQKNYFGDTGLMVLVNPTDVVAVPPQDDYGKMRTAAYYPVGVVEWDDSGQIVSQDIEDGFEDDFMDKICYNGERNSNDQYPYMVNIPEMPEINKSLINDRLIQMASGLNKVTN